jgi:hypothetical protein
MSWSGRGNSETDRTTPHRSHAAATSADQDDGATGRSCTMGGHGKVSGDNELIAARARAGMTQEAVAQRRDTTKSAAHSGGVLATTRHPSAHSSDTQRLRVRDQDRARAEGEMKVDPDFDWVHLEHGGRHRVRTCDPSRVKRVLSR